MTHRLWVTGERRQSIVTDPKLSISHKVWFATSSLFPFFFLSSDSITFNNSIYIQPLTMGLCCSKRSIVEETPRAARVVQLPPPMQSAPRRQQSPVWVNPSRDHLSCISSLYLDGPPSVRTAPNQPRLRYRSPWCETVADGSLG